MSAATIAEKRFICAGCKGNFIGTAPYSYVPFTFVPELANQPRFTQPSHFCSVGCTELTEPNAIKRSPSEIRKNF